MSEYIPRSSIEYAALQKEVYLAPKVCKISSIEWRTGRNFMVFFLWNERLRYVNIAKDCRQRFGRLNEEVRNAVIEAAPDALTISTSVKKFDNNKHRFLHSLKFEELDAWLERAELIKSGESDESDESDEPVES